MSVKRQVTLPIQVAHELGLHPGDEFRVEARNGDVVLSPTSVATRRRVAAIRRAAGSLTGMYGRDYLKKLRSEWR